MVSLNTLYAQAEQQNIPVLRFPMPGCESMSIQLPDGSCAIGLDSGPGTETGFDKGPTPRGTPSPGR